MIARIKIAGNYLETIDPFGKRIARDYNNDQVLGYSSEIVVTKEGNYVSVLDENLRKIARIRLDFDDFIGAAGETFSVLQGNYVETYDKNGKKISRTYDN